MIISLLPQKSDVVANQFHFRTWQIGLLADMFEWSHHSRGNGVRSINMGRQAGHTYFARCCAAKGFHFRTKIYVANQSSLVEYYSLLFGSNKVHEPIEFMTKATLLGNLSVDFVIVDMGNESTKEVRTFLLDASVKTKIILLQAKI